MRLAAPALGAGGEVEVGLPGEVLDLAAAENGVLGRIFEVDRLAAGFHRQQWAQTVGQSFEGDIDRGQEDVQVLGVQHDQQEDQRHSDMGQQRDRLDPLVGAETQRVHERAHGVREECAIAVGEGSGVRRGTAEDREAEDDQEDHEQNQPGAAGVRTVEAGLAAIFLWLAP